MRAGRHAESAELRRAVLAPLFLPGEEATKNPMRVALAAAVIGTTVYLVALALSFLLPTPRDEAAPGEPLSPPPAVPD